MDMTSRFMVCYLSILVSIVTIAFYRAYREDRKETIEQQRHGSRAIVPTWR